jgi:DNA adenine methylase
VSAPTAQKHNFFSPLRYPGGKAALANFMKRVIRENRLLDGEYVEVYAGGAGIAWSLLIEEYVSRIHINDINLSLMWFWQAVVDEPDGLCRLIAATPVTLDEWRRQRLIYEHPTEHSGLEVGFSTFFLNRTNRSGIISGGVIGGQAQRGRWALDARFNKEDLIQRIRRIARYRDRIALYWMDAAAFIRAMPSFVSQRVLVYLDPPYYRRGEDLYENHYQPDDHKAIAKLTRSIRAPWIVSYDDVPEINQMYETVPSIHYGIEYSAQSRYSGAEVMFHHPRLKLPVTHSPTRIGVQ